MSYQLIELISNISLSWAYPFTGDLVVADINNVDARHGGFIMTLPPANNVSTGTSIIFNNIGNTDFIIAEYGSINTVVRITAGQIYLIYLTDSTDAAGKWQPIPFGGGTNAITALTATSLDNSIIIDNGAITTPGGTIDFSLPLSISNLNKIITPGIVVTLTEDQLTYTTRSLVPGTNIDIINPDGVADNPVINVRQNLTKLTSVQVTDNAGNTVVINPTGVAITDDLGNIATLSSRGLQVANSRANPIPSNAAAWGCFTDTGSGCTSSIAVQSGYNIASVTGSKGVYTVTFTNLFTSNNYAVLTSLQRQGSNLTPSLSFVQSKQDSSLVVVCTDTLGNLLPPYDGVSFIVFSN